MQKWEYGQIGLHWNPEKEDFVWDDKEDDNRTIMEVMNELGKDGWELVGIDSKSNMVGMTISTTFYFKRPID